MKKKDFKFVKDLVLSNKAYGGGGDTDFFYIRSIGNKNLDDKQIAVPHAIWNMLQMADQALKTAEMLAK